jgi:hypothetical protein
MVQYGGVLTERGKKEVTVSDRCVGWSLKDLTNVKQVGDGE